MPKKLFPEKALLELYCNVLKQWPCKYEHRELTTRKGKTFVTICGKHDGPPMILLHGAQSNSAFWMFDAQRWARDFRVYAVDIIGEPGLSACTRPALNSADYSDWLSDVMDELRIESASIVGLSFGGWIALKFSVHYPHRVDALSLLAPGGIGRQRNFLLKAFPLLFLGKWGMNKIREMVMGPMPTSIPEIYKPMFDLLDRINTEIRPRPMKLPLLSDSEIASIRAPMQVIIGAKDPLIDQHHSRERIRQCAPTSVLVFLLQAHHYIPDQAETIAAFMTSNVRTRSRQGPGFDRPAF